MVVTRTRAEDQGQRSVGWKDRVEQTDGQTDRRTETIALPLPRANAVNIDSTWRTSEVAVLMELLQRLTDRAATARRHCISLCMTSSRPDSSVINSRQWTGEL